MTKPPIGIAAISGVGAPARGRNQTQYGFSKTLCLLLGDQDLKYAIRAIYAEFENVGSPGDTVTPPGFAQSEDTEYYAGLAADPNKDYLRLPLSAAPARSLDPGVPGGAYNRLTFTARAVPGTAVHGLRFNNDSNSLVYGLALVVAPVWGDPGFDIVVARKYYDVADQKALPVVGQLALDWDETFPC